MIELTVEIFQTAFKLGLVLLYIGAVLFALYLMIMVPYLLFWSVVFAWGAFVEREEGDGYWATWREMWEML